jgi:Tol biopolymer transport system component
VIPVVRLLVPGWQIVALAFAAGCGFTPPGAAPIEDAPPPDTIPSDGPGSDGLTDGPPATCLERWRNGTVTLGAPARLTELGSTAMDRDPFVSPDELAIYFSTYRNGTQNGDVFAATRASISAAFDPPARRDDISSPSGDSRFSMTSDGMLGIVASDRAGTEGNSDVWIATRMDASAPFGTFGKTEIDNINTVNTELDPELSADGLQIYLAIGSPQRIAVSVRPSTSSSFGSAQQIDPLFSDMGDADPSVSPDELVIVFASRRTTGGGDGNGDVWYARRPTRAAAFGAPVRVPAVNSANGDGDPALSADGCRLYFASDRTGDWELFVAAVTP